MPASKPPVSYGNVITLAVVLLSLAVGWGTLHARLNDVEKHVNGLTPAVVELRVAVAELTATIKHEHGEP